MPSDWTLHFVETGQEATIADRLRAVEPYFTAKMLSRELQRWADRSSHCHDISTPFAPATRSPDSWPSGIPDPFHIVSVEGAGRVTALTRAQDADVWINAGFFIFRPRFSTICRRATLVEQPFSRLIDAGRCMATSTVASGSRSTPTRTRSTWIAGTIEGILPGWSGENDAQCLS